MPPRSPTRWTKAALADRVRQAQTLSETEYYDSALDERINRTGRDYYIPHPQPPPVKHGFPFFQSGDDLYMFVTGMVEERMASWDTKADVAQEMALAILSGQISRDELASDPDSFITKKFRKFAIGVNHCIVSLDALIDDDGEVTLLDVLDIKGCLTELKGGKNYETQQARFERPTEHFDGELCARY